MIGFLISNLRSLLKRIRNRDTEPHTAESVMEAKDEDRVKAESEKTLGTSSEAGDSKPRSRRRRSRRRPDSRKRSPSEDDTTSSDISVARPQEDHSIPWDLSRFEVPAAEGKTRFHDMDLSPEVMHAIADLGFQYCTPIQAEIMPHVLKGADAAGRAQTGTGKTAVFLISMITHMLRNPIADRRRPGTPRALILAPTRELVLQIEKDAKQLSRYTPLRTIAVFGGMDYEKQRRLLGDGAVDIVAATPGRLLDFCQREDMDLSQVEILVIDEADRMLDMGFIPDVKRIVRKTPSKSKRQTMFFSATLTPEITRLASEWTSEPVSIEIEPEHVAVETVDQIIYITTMEEKFTLLFNMITQQNIQRIIVFGNRRDETRRLTERLKEYGISCALLSGEVDQRKRIRTLEDFREGKIRVLVATDVAARGLHVEGVSHVVNYNLPIDPEDYVHRIGRTGRAGAFGSSVSFSSEDYAFQIPGIEKFIGRPLACVYPEETLLQKPPPPPRYDRVPPPQPRSRNTWQQGSRHRGMRSRKNTRTQEKTVV